MRICDEFVNLKKKTFKQREIISQSLNSNITRYRHSLRRFLVNVTVYSSTLKCHGGWKFSFVSLKCLEESFQNKIQIGEKLQVFDTSASCSTISRCIDMKPSGFNKDINIYFKFEQTVSVSFNFNINVNPDRNSNT